MNKLVVLITSSLLACIAATELRAQSPSKEVVGAIPGSFEVTLSGSASYAIPITVAPGAGGTEPKLQLSYDSQSPPSVLGSGWSIAGLSVITRGPKDQFTDGVTGGVNLDDADAFFLDGQRLIPISLSGSGPSKTIEYRKFFDDQTRIIQSGASFGSSVFSVHTKGGLQIIFDGSNNSRVTLADGSVLAMAESFLFDSQEITFSLNIL